MLIPIYEHFFNYMNILSFSIMEDTFGENNSFAIPQYDGPIDEYKGINY